MSTTKERRQTATSEKLDYRDTARLAALLCEWQPALVSRFLIRIASAFTVPLEQGSHFGRRLPGEPHRASWTIAGPLTVFALDGVSYRRKVLLAARLRRPASVNLVDISRGEPSGASGLRRLARAFKRAPGPEALVRSGFVVEPQVRKEWAQGGTRLEALLALQQQSAYTLTLVPLAHTTHQYTPQAPGVSVADKAAHVSPWKGVRRVLGRTRTVRTGGLKNGETLDLKRWLARQAEAGEAATDLLPALRIELASRLASERRACEGPPLVSPRQVRHKVLADPLLAAYMQRYALEEGLSAEAVLQEAQGYVEEIASDYRVGVVRWFARAVDYVFDRFLEGVEVDRSGIRFLSRCDSRNRIVLVCSHKSYVDPLLIGYSLFRSGLVPPQQAAGQNLSFWPVGWLLRHSGAFYLRRTFAGETLYREVFHAYVRYLLACNYVTALYVEGTRSRDGKLAKPKLGFLGVLEDCLDKGVCPDVTLVPVYLGYDKVPEEGAHVKEMAGGHKVGESVKGFAKIAQSINTRLGKAYVRFGAPQSMRGLLAAGGLEHAANEVAAGIDAVTPVTPRSLAAAALLAPGTQWVSRADRLDDASFLAGLARRRGLEAPDREAVSRCFDWFVTEGHLAPTTRQGVDGLSFQGRGRRFLEYNKNTALCHFTVDSLVAACLDVGEGVVAPEAERLAFLRELCSEEFIELSGDRWDGAVRQALEATALAGRQQVELLASLTRPLLEGYLVAACAMAGLEPGVSLSRDGFIAECFEEGERLAQEGMPLREESCSRVTFGNAARRFKRMELLAEHLETDERGRVSPVLTVSAGAGAEALAARLRAIL